ncbi:MAG: hypothetical protein KDA42_02700 [Planctomycetales bacterium]|nr:hypothetical protein [Planctomycetales bacterium]
MALLDREEYVEQGYFFRMLCERLPENQATQDLFGSIRQEILATTKLPMAIDYLLSELKHMGVFGPAMRRLGHYFTAFQAYIVDEAENDRGRFDLRVALDVLRHMADYMAAGASPQGMFLYQFETLCRNRLRYDQGLAAMCQDPIFDASWGEWIESVRRRIGMIDLADMIYVRSEYYGEVQSKAYKSVESAGDPLFGVREGRIALANRRKDPLYLFAALQRQLGYPRVPRPKPVDTTEQLVPQLSRRLEHLERRLKLLEEEQRGGIDLAQFFQPPSSGE